jgi:hypothetical protein
MPTGASGVENVCMLNRRLLLKLAVGLLIPLSSVALLALPETPSQILPHGPHGFCYCGCDKMMGQKRCLKLCELPKYENRWWATSCHKRTLTPEAAPAPAKPVYHTSRHYRSLQARNQASTTPGMPNGGAF